MNPTKTAIRIGAVALLTLASGTALTAPPDWSKVPATKFTLLYPGASPLEWITKVSEHGGARGLRHGETCASCHNEDGPEVSAQAANDGENLYLRFSWKQPPAASSAEKRLDKDNQIKLTVMLEDHKVEGADQLGCWVMCHGDARTMPGVKDDSKTKYIKDASLASGKFMDLMQWASKTGKNDGYVADKRVMTGGKALIDAVGEKKGDEWTVVFTRELAGAGSDGDIALASGKTYNIGFAIHDDYTVGRFHDVSLNYTLGIDTKADITANKP